MSAQLGTGAMQQLQSRRRVLPPRPVSSRPGRTHTPISASLWARRASFGGDTHGNTISDPDNDGRPASPEEDMERLQNLPQEILAQLISVQNDKSIIPGQGFDDIKDTSSSSSSSLLTPVQQKGRSSSQVKHRRPKSGERVDITLVEGSFWRIAGMTEASDVSGSFVIRTVGLQREKGKASLGFYVCQGDGWSRKDGVFVSRVVLGSIVEINGLLSVGDEILKVNNVDVVRLSLEDVAVIMKYMSKLVLTVKVLTSVSLSSTWSIRKHPSELSFRKKNDDREFEVLPRHHHEGLNYGTAHSSTGVMAATTLTAQERHHERDSGKEASHTVESRSQESTPIKTATIASLPPPTLSSELPTECRDNGSYSKQVEFTELVLPSHSHSSPEENIAIEDQCSGMLTLTMHSICMSSGPSTEHSSLACVVSLDTGPFFHIEAKIKKEGVKEVFVGDVYKMDMVQSSQVTFSVMSTAGEKASQMIPLSQLLKPVAGEDQSEAKHLLLKMDPIGHVKFSLRYQPMSVAIPRLSPNGEQSSTFSDYVALSPTGSGLPLVLERCIEIVEQHGLETPGIYQCIATECEKKEASSVCQSVNYRDTVLHISVHAFAGVVLDFFRNLPEPFFTSDICSTLMEAVRMSNAAQVIGSLIECLPEEVGMALDALVKHLRRVREHSALNNASREKLGKIFGPLLLSPAFDNDSTSEMQDSINFNAQAQIIELILSFT